MAIPTHFGFQYSRKNWDLSGYSDWYQFYCQQVNLDNKKGYYYAKLPLLSKDQIDFLSAWQIQNHQQFDHIQFIQSLKQKFKL